MTEGVPEVPQEGMPQEGDELQDGIDTARVEDLPVEAALAQLPQLLIVHLLFLLITDATWEFGKQTKQVSSKRAAGSSF